MAEAIGVIASAVQIADSAVKLQKLWTGLKEMPETVHNMVEDVNLLANTLAQIQTMPLPETVVKQNAVAWNDCFQKLQTVSTSFQSFVNDLDKQITMHRKSGSIKAFLRRDKLAECKERLERLKTTMMLAQQAYSHAFFTQQNLTMHSMLTETLQAVRMQQQPGKSTSLSIVKRPPEEDIESIGATTDQSLVKHSKSYGAGRNFSRNKKQFNIQLPTWIFRKGVQVLADRSYGAWNFNLRIYNRVSKDSEVFQAANREDWTMVQCLFDAGRASPFDVAEANSLMHVAAENADIFGCRFLMNHGLEPHPTVSMWLSPLESLACYLKYCDKDSTKVMEVVHLLAPSFEDCVIDSDKDFIGLFEFPLEAVRSVTTAMSPIYNKIEPLRRAKTLAVYRGPDSESIPLILGSDLSLLGAFALLRDASERKDLNHRSLLENITLPFAQRMHDDSAVQILVGNWRHIVSEIITFERQIDKPLPFSSHIQYFLDNCLRKIRLPLIRRHEHGSIWSQKLTSTIRAWVGFLLAVGVDLKNYAIVEKNCFLSRDSTRYWDDFYVMNQGFSFRISGLLCGPSVDDWFVYAVNAEGYDDEFGSEYEMAGDFWEWIENPELHLIPGSYPEELDDMESEGGVYMTIGPVY